MAQNIDEILARWITDSQLLSKIACVRIGEMKVRVGGRLCADDSLCAVEDQLRQRWDTVVKFSNETSGCQSTDRPILDG